jgi:drug/metabolite transporter (DMT)-like permease
MSTVVFSLFAACLWGASDFKGGVLSRTLPAFTVLLGVEVAGLGASALALAISGATLPSADSVAWSLGAGAAGAVALVLLFQAMAIGQISIVAPISGCGAVVPVVVGLAAGEQPGPLPLAGISLGLLGCLLASQESAAEAVGGSQRASIVLALLAMIGVGTYLTGIHYATEDTAIWWPLLLGRIGSVSVALLALAAGSATLPRTELSGIAFVGLADFGASLAYAAATSKGLLTLAAVLASLYPVVSVLLARLTLHERLIPIQLAGVTLALVGACMMATY